MVLTPAMMLVESGMVLAYELDKTPAAGFSGVISAALLGDPLRERVERGGLHFEISV
jgi:hypothetical protein